ncbi:Arc family DNA-binding protein [Xenorhabdus sp. XENO-10]|uniref:Arc family DNA-binding protein n=1 Tax=Xenorhabdus yunnanensis TaxID=3025878 RepID=A0ABT5LKP8_9GAMM|nr:Arc family DNA-binding protein [Xenorhabdus yunnanensis]MDC9591138.1 Arc family DNA-binding protein [Xenorhabdus yunnanensis]
MATIDRLVAGGYHVNIIIAPDLLMSREPQINIRLPQDLKEAVQNMASDNKRSVNAEIVAVLLDAVRRHKSREQSQLSMKHQSTTIDPKIEREILEEIAKLAAENAVKLERNKEDKK